MDDGTLAGDYETVLDDFRNIIIDSKKIGLEINASKCEICFIKPETSKEISKVAGKFCALAPGIKIVEASKLILLGSPIFPSAAKIVLEEKQSELKKMLEQLQEMDSHDAFYILKNSLALPKLLFFLRSSPFFKTDQLKDFDNLQREGLEDLLNVQMNHNRWTQASLPVKQGGLGIRSVCDISTSAFLSSYYNCKNLIEVCSPNICKDQQYNYGEEALRLWQKSFNLPAHYLPNDLKRQASWDSVGCKKIFDHLLETVESKTDKARLQAISQEHASDWVQALPIPSLGLKLDNRQFKIVMALRLGAKICQEHDCICGKKVSTNGIHGLSCTKSAGRHPRHGQVNDLIKRALVSGGMAATKEPNGISRSDGKRPDGMSLYPWKRGKQLLWDFTCGDTVAESYIDASVKEPGKVACEAEKRKIKHYEHLMHSYHFVPVSVETYGTFGELAQELIRDIGKLIMEQSGEKRSTAFLFQSIGIAVQRGNAISVQGTMKEDKDSLEEIFLVY